MPIRGRINRRDNLRSKVASNNKLDVKTRSNKKGSVTVQTRKFSEAKGVSDVLFTSPRRSKKILGSDSSVSGVGDIYVSLKDFMSDKNGKEKSYANTVTTNTKRVGAKKSTVIHNYNSIISSKKVELAVNKDSDENLNHSIKDSRGSYRITKTKKLNKVDNLSALEKDIDNPKKVKGSKIEKSSRRHVKKLINVISDDKPFVVELDCEDDPSIAYKDKDKIPGLAFLEDIKNKKSRNSSDDKSLKIPGLKSIIDIRRRKNQLVSTSKDDKYNKRSLSKTALAKRKKRELEFRDGVVGIKTTKNVSKLKFQDASPIKSKEITAKKIKLGLIEEDLPTVAIKKRMSVSNLEETLNSQITPKRTRSRVLLHRRSDDQSKKPLKDKSKNVDNLIAKQESPIKKTKNKFSEDINILPTKMVRRTTIGFDSEIVSDKNNSKIVLSPSKKGIRISRSQNNTPDIRFRKSVLDAYSDSEMNNNRDWKTTENGVTGVRKRKSIFELSGRIDSHNPAMDSGKMSRLSLNDDILERKSPSVVHKRVESPFPRDNSEGRHTPKIKSRPPLSSVYESSSLRSLKNPKNTTFDVVNSESQKSDRARPCPLKRPISSLAEEYGEKFATRNEPKEKIARLQESTFVESPRQSVAFNNLIEVKEINGNSFSSESGATDTSEGNVIDLSELKRQVKERMEQTKRELIKKRLDAAVSSGVGSSSTNNSLGVSHGETDGEIVSGRRFGLRHLESRRTNIDSLASKVRDNEDSSVKATKSFNLANPSFGMNDCDLRSKCSSTKHFKKSVVVSKEDLEEDDDDNKGEASMSCDVSDSEIGGADRGQKWDRCTIL